MNPARLAAARAGKRHYAGEPCPKGHQTRYVSNGKCVQCALDNAVRQAKTDRALLAKARKQR